MRLIDADSKEIKENTFSVEINDYTAISVVPLDVLNKLSSIDAVPAVHGEWAILIDDGDLFNHICCTHCGFYWSYEGHAKIFKYCPHCGAKMDLEE